MHRVIHLVAESPAQPAPGAPCNGCGVCCAAEPCPAGIIFSRRLRGTCVALGWDEASRRYRCGALAEPRRWLRWLPEPLAATLMRRWIAAGRGCDTALQRQA